MACWCKLFITCLICFVCILFYSYVIFKKCWKPLPDDRPSFEDLVSMLDKRLQAVAGYTELAMILEDTCGTLLSL